MHVYVTPANKPHLTSPPCLVLEALEQWIPIAFKLTEFFTPRKVQCIAFCSQRYVTAMKLGKIDEVLHIGPSVEFMFDIWGSAKHLQPRPQAILFPLSDWTAEDAWNRAQPCPQGAPEKRPGDEVESSAYRNRRGRLRNQGRLLTRSQDFKNTYARVDRLDW